MVRTAGWHAEPLEIAIKTGRGKTIIESWIGYGCTVSEFFKRYVSQASEARGSYYSVQRLLGPPTDESMTGMTVNEIVSMRRRARINRHSILVEWSNCRFNRTVLARLLSFVHAQDLLPDIENNWACQYDWKESGPRFPTLALASFFPATFPEYKDKLVNHRAYDDVCMPIRVTDEFLHYQPRENCGALALALKTHLGWRRGRDLPFTICNANDWYGWTTRYQKLCCVQSRDIFTVYIALLLPIVECADGIGREAGFRRNAAGTSRIDDHIVASLS